MVSTLNLEDYEEETGDVEDDLFVKNNKTPDLATTVESASTDDDALSYFSKLADED